MGTSIQERAGRFQLRVTHALLPRAFFHTFDSRPEAEAYRDKLVGLLKRGIVPEAFLGREAPRTDPLLVQIVRGYSQSTAVTASDAALLDVIVKELAGVRWSQARRPAWIDGYVSSLKRRERNLTPGSIRKRIGALARVVDWHLRDTESSERNPFRNLPRGYSLYSDADAKLVEPKHDTVRDRALGADEAARINAALAGVKRKDRQRAWGPDPEFALLYRLIVEQGLRLSEAYRQRVSGLDFERRLVHVDGSKGHRGRAKPRVMPMAPSLVADLRAWCRGRVGLVFSYWDGTPEGRKRVTGALSARFRTLFSYADVPDFTEHDLRHEATVRWLLMRDTAGRWAFTEMEICRFLGWTDPKIMLRYASVRGEQWAERLG
jgi:integrase